MSNDKEQIAVNRIKRIFPAYFEQYNMPPQEAREESLVVYRACKTNRLERESFLPSFEEQGFQFVTEEEKQDPSTFSLSVYEKPRDVKRFATMNSSMRPPYTIAKGKTNPIYGKILRTKEYKPERKKSSHIDWWLYEGAEPYHEFVLIEDFGKYMEERKRSEEHA